MILPAVVRVSWDGFADAWRVWVVGSFDYRFVEQPRRRGVVL